ncbi:hypothetical protein AALP_AA8G198500 [Arabis alpina]|uniref:RING-type domain-containing protein n=1 Tax=Arabis alpina TaxID=50452 RepID=A0A087G862_ARAAL|nr:hypothetical protein AALP_AA8G198500 [Arabis alpina]
MITFRFEELVWKSLSLESGESTTELKTGALCCIVASRPLVTTKSSPHSGRRDVPSLSQDDDLQWRMNLSYSPAGYTRDGFEQDLSDESPGFALPSSTSRSRKSLESCFQQSPRWDLFASGGNEAKTCTANSIPRSSSSKHQSLNEDKGIDRASTSFSPSIRSLLSLLESTAPLETPRKQPFSFTHSSYPQVFSNPVSHSENPKPDISQNLSTNPDSSFRMSTTTRNHQDSPVEEASPTSSSNDMLLDVERSNETEVGNARLEPGSTTHQRCGVCKKLLSQRSPWCSYKILRCVDMPTAGVFPCHHVYHVECLDEVTPTAQSRNPLCPVCSNTIGEMEQPLVMPETLQLALRSLRRSRTAVESEPRSNDNQTRHIRRRRNQTWEKLSCCFNLSFPSSSQNPT